VAGMAKVAAETPITNAISKLLMTFSGYVVVVIVDVALLPGHLLFQNDGIWEGSCMRLTAKELTAKQIFMLFPTPMFTGKLPDITVCDRVERKVRELQKSGKGTFSPEGAILAYMSPDDLQTLPEMKELVDVVMEESGIILDAFAIKRNSHYITNMWANIANPNRRHNMHMHPNCFLSGLVYIKTPQNCGPTAFASPRFLSKNLEPSYFKKNDLNSDVFIMPAEKGRMVIWPSHMPHAVEQGTANETEERIVVAFNIMTRGLIDLPTARLDMK
jgi:uncharacterized protein (TIGR02466 family)